MNKIKYKVKESWTKIFYSLMYKVVVYAQNRRSNVCKIRHLETKAQHLWTKLDTRLQILNINFLQPDVQEGGGRSVQKQTQQRAHDVPHEGRSEMFNILYHKPQIIYIFSLSTKGQL